MDVNSSQIVDSRVMVAKIGKSIFQFPKEEAASPAITGPRNEAMALMNCPQVRLLVSRSPRTTLESNGLSDTCKRVLPIPKRAKAMSITGKV